MSFGNSATEEKVSRKREGRTCWRGISGIPLLNSMSRKGFRVHVMFE